MDVILEALNNLQGETALYSQGVQSWMKVMGFSFLASLAFVYSKPASRWILLAFVLNIIGLISGRILFPETSRTILGTYVHLMFWPVILFLIWRKPPTLMWPNANGFEKTYVVWICWASLLMFISVVLDLRTFVNMF